MKKWVLFVAAALVLLLGGFAAGRFSGPSKTVEHTIETRLKTEVHNHNYKVDTAELQKMVQEQFAKLQKNIRRDTTTTKLPDGTEITKTTETDTSTSESGTKSASETARTSSSSGTSSSMASDLKVDEKFKQAEYGRGPTWAVGASVTYQPWGEPGFNLVPNQRLVVGVTLERRVWGPLWGGLVLNSNLAVGGSLKLVH